MAYDGGEGVIRMDYAHAVVQVNATCRQCGTVATAVTAEYAFERWFCDGEPIQSAMPEAPAATREVFMGWKSNFYLCDTCWPEED